MDPFPIDAIPPSAASSTDEETGMDTLDFQELAEGLSELSRDAAIPEGRGPEEGRGIEEFSAEVPDFESLRWVYQVVSIQHWLGLDEPIAEGDPPEATLRSLFRQIPPGNADGCFEKRQDGTCVLLRPGLDRLLARVEKALELRVNFLERIEGGAPLAEATQEWMEAWEEEGTQIRRPIADIHASVEKWRIKVIRELARENKLDLDPAWQRDVVWSNKDSNMLITSILRGIPLPSIILSSNEDGTYQIVDGKQRLTSILRFIGEHPKCTSFVESKGEKLDEFQKDFSKFFKKHKITPKDQEQHFLPFKLNKYSDSSDYLADFSNKFYSQIKKLKVKRIGNPELVANIFESISSVYEIPVLIFRDTKLQDIHQVFSLYNRQGKKLNAEELRNAIFHHLNISKMLMCISGDRSTKELMEELVGFLPLEIKNKINKTGSLLEDKGFGTTRFKRTKILGWATSILLHSPNQYENGKYAASSTASHIDSMLNHIQNTPSHKMYQGQGLVNLAKDIIEAVEFHQVNINAWPPSIRNKSRHAGKWEDLPIVAALLTCIILVATGNGHRLSSNLGGVRDALAKGRLPKKTQNSTQWQFIAEETLFILETLGIDLDQAGSALQARYGANCLAVLKGIVDGAPERCFPAPIPVAVEGH